MEFTLRYHTAKDNVDNKDLSKKEKDALDTLDAQDVTKMDDNNNDNCTSNDNDNRIVDHGRSHRRTDSGYDTVFENEKPARTPPPASPSTVGHGTPSASVLASVSASPLMLPQRQTQTQTQTQTQSLVPPSAPDALSLYIADRRRRSTDSAISVSMSMSSAMTDSYSASASVQYTFPTTKRVYKQYSEFMKSNSKAALKKVRRYDDEDYADADDEGEDEGEDEDEEDDGSVKRMSRSEFMHALKIRDRVKTLDMPTAPVAPVKPFKAVEPVPSVEPVEEEGYDWTDDDRMDNDWTDNNEADDNETDDNETDNDEADEDWADDGEAGDDWADDTTTPAHPFLSTVFRAVDLQVSLPDEPTTPATELMVVRDPSPQDIKKLSVAVRKFTAGLTRCLQNEDKYKHIIKYTYPAPLFPEVDKNTRETPWMTILPGRIVARARTYPARDNRPYRNHPHHLDLVGHRDHLLVVRRPWNDVENIYVDPESLGNLKIRRGSFTFKWAEPLSEADEEAVDFGSIGKKRSGRYLEQQRILLLLARGIIYDPLLTLDDQMSKPYLSYYDVTLYYEDVHVLRNDWLTDNNITFWQEYLEHEVLPKYPQARIVLLRAVMSVMLMNARIEAARDFLPKFDHTTHIFLPISDAAIRNQGYTESGSHWSLLLISITDGVAFHYDSMGGTNTHAARNVATRMAAILNTPLRFRDIEDTPQQANNIDCGVFVCVLMRFLLVKRLLNAHAREKVSMSLGGKMIDAQGGRQEMLRIVENLRREAERRRSASPLNLGKKSVPRIE